MTHYLESNKFYVKNEEGKVYEVRSYQTWSETKYLSLNLYLIGYFDENGFHSVSPDYDGDDASETVNQYFFSEGMHEALECNDYEILDEKPEDGILTIEKCKEYHLYKHDGLFFVDFYDGKPNAGYTTREGALEAIYYHCN